MCVCSLIGRPIVVLLSSSRSLFVLGTPYLLCAVPVVGLLSVIPWSVSCIPYSVDRPPCLLHYSFSSPLPPPLLLLFSLLSPSPSKSRSAQRNSFFLRLPLLFVKHLHKTLVYHISPLSDKKTLLRPLDFTSTPQLLLLNLLLLYRHSTLCQSYRNRTLRINSYTTKVLSLPYPCSHQQRYSHRRCPSTPPTSHYTLTPYPYIPQKLFNHQLI